MGAIVGTLIARLGGDKNTKPRDLIPRWDTEGSLEAGWAQLVRMAEGGADANDRNAGS